MNSAILLLGFLAAANAVAFNEFNYHLDHNGIAKYLYARYKKSDFSDCDPLQPSYALVDVGLLQPLNLNANDRYTTIFEKANTTTIVTSSGKQIAKMVIKLNPKRGVDMLSYQSLVELNEEYPIHNKTSVITNRTVISFGSLELFYSIPKNRPQCKQLQSVKGTSLVVESWNLKGLVNSTLWTSAAGEGRLVAGSIGNDYFKLDGKSIVQHDWRVLGHSKTAKESKKGTETVTVGSKP